LPSDSHCTLFQGSSEDTGLSLLMRSPEDAVNGPILDERYICCNLRQDESPLYKSRGR